MKQIDIHNYEAYLLDFSEGNLTDELQMELELFLIQHPQLDVNLSELSLMSIKEETVSFSDKSNLKKSDADLISEHQFVSYIEHQLTENEKVELEKSCSINPSLAKELALYKKTITLADSNITFPNKNELKRKAKIIWFDFSTSEYVAAACILFLIGLALLWPKTDVINSSNLANNSQNKIKQGVIIKNENPITSIKDQTSNTYVVKENSHLIQKSNPIITNSKNSITLLANTITLDNAKNDVSKKDSIIKTVVPENLTNTYQNETLIAINTSPNTKKQSNTVVQVITENDDEPTVSNDDKKKKGIWATASRALKNLNHAGVKSVNGNENDTKETSSYALTLGGVSITHKAGL